MTTEVEYSKYNENEYFINHLNLYQLQLPFLFLNNLQIRNESDIEVCIQRYSQFDQLFAQLERELEKREEAGILPPAFVIEKTHERLLQFISSTIETNMLLKGFENKLSRLSLTQERKDEVLNRAQAAIGEDMINAYQELAEYISELKDKTVVTGGVWQLPEGDDFYAYTLKKLTTTDLSPQEIHDFGLQEVAKIQKELKTVLDHLGYDGVKINQALEILAEKNQLTDDDEVLSLVESLTQEAKKVVPHWIDCSYDFEIPVFITRAGMMPVYYSPQGFFIDMSFPQTRHSLPMKVYHELIPGHGFYYTFLTKYINRNMPFSNNYVSSAFKEGWALYSEQLGYENGMYKDQEIVAAYLQAQLQRAARLVVDTGLHYKHWSKEEAIKYFSETTGLTETAEEEVERYLVWPGQACTYTIGLQSFINVRKTAQSELGDQLNIGDFHHHILSYGPIPEKALELVVEQYIKMNK